MIIKQYLDVIQGNKSQTRRMKDRYQVGRVYSVVPKMYQPTVKYACVGMDQYAIWHPTDPLLSVDDWIPLQIRITAKRQEPLQALTEENAWAEGIYQNPDNSRYLCHLLTTDYETAVECYAALWDFINKKPGTRWCDNPIITAYWFEVVQ